MGGGYRVVCDQESSSSSNATSAVVFCCRMELTSTVASYAVRLGSQKTEL